MATKYETQLGVMVDAEMHEMLKEESERQHCSMSVVIRRAVSEYLGSTKYQPVTTGLTTYNGDYQ